MADSGNARVQRALILAAGQGRSVDKADTPNCLAQIGGISLLGRTLRTLVGAGVRDIGIAIGFEGEQVREAAQSAVQSEPVLSNVQLSFFENPEWQRPNGLSVLAARSFFEAPVLIVMADQIAAPHLVSEMAALSAPADKVVVGIDHEVARVFDPADATKVRSEGDRITAIGKQLQRSDGVSSSLIVAGSFLIEQLEALQAPSLTDGLQRAAEAGALYSYDVQGALWQDVDSPDMRTHADWLLRVHGDALVHPEVAGGTHSRAAETMALVERLVSEKDLPRSTMLTPGPVMTSPRVKTALVHRDMSHRDLGYEAVIRSLRSKLKKVFLGGDTHEIVLLAGSGTAVMEQSIASVVPRGKKILIVVNGAFGERLEEIAEVHGIEAVVHRQPWGQLPDVAAIEKALDADAEISAVAMIHHETSVGLLNPVGEIGAICQKREALLIVDAVSSLGSEDLDVVRDGVDVCYSSANKCLHSIAGVSFACVSPRVWPRVEKIPPRSFYLNLARYRKYHSELNQTPFTPAVSASIALDVALDELEEAGGVPARRAAYRLLNLRIRQVLTGLGFESFTKTGQEAHSLCTLRVPEPLNAETLYAQLRDRGFLTYRCKGELAEHYLQIANMGEIPDTAVDDFLAAVTEIVEQAAPQRAGAQQG